MNTYSTPTYSKLLTLKLSKLLADYQAGTKASGVTLERQIAGAHGALARFYKSMSEPIFSLRVAVPGTAPTSVEWDSNLKDIVDDLEMLFMEFEHVESIVLGQFNYMSSRFNRVNTRLKKVASDLGDYKLFSGHPSRDTLFFSDTFTNLSRVDSASSLLNSTECQVHQDEGLVTLPLDTTATSAISISQTPVINVNSNGVPGNNHEVVTNKHNDIADLLDLNSDTWYEYERVLKADDGVPLVLDFTINLGEEKIINFIRINPNNFGTKTQIKIDKIDTSTDGDKFVSVRDDIPIAGFAIDDPDDIFTLAPATSKYAGQGLFTFTPRTAKYIRITLKQTTPYSITTSTGAQRFRYGIGLRDVHVEARKYKTKGEIISRAFSPNDDVRKVILLANEAPLTTSKSNLSSIKHYISPDNGITWHQLRPPSTDGTSATTQTVPEILDFNGVSKNTIATTSPVKTLRYKAVMERSSAAFKVSSSELAQETDDETELHQPPASTPFTIALQKTPVTGSLKLVDTNFGSRGYDDEPYFIGTGTGSKLLIHLPFSFKKDIDKPWQFVAYFLPVWGGYDANAGYELLEQDQFTISVGGEEWTNSLSTSSAATAKHYRLNNEARTLEFGNGTIGMAVPLGQAISISLTEERLFPSAGAKHIAKLQYPTVADKKRVVIERVGEMRQKTQVLQQGRKTHQLDKGVLVIDPYAPKFSNTTTFATQVLTEVGDVDATGEWFIDVDTGVLTSYDNANTSSQTTITYYYIPRTVLSEDDWDFVDDGTGVTNAVSIHDDAYITIDENNYLGDGIKYYSMAEVAIAKNSVVFPTGASYQKEVPFIDGRTELLGVLKTKEEVADITGITVATNLPPRSFSMGVSTDTSLEVRFSNAHIFQTEVAGVPSAVGEYQLDRALNQYIVRVDSNYSDAGNVQYYYPDPSADLTGSYSINYETGEIFFHDTAVKDDQISFRFTNYRVKYPIAREVPTSDWTLDKTTKKVTLKDREILRNLRTPQGKGPSTFSATKYYQASYRAVKKSRPNTLALEPYFSPFLRDYSIKALTASRLV